MEIDCNSTEYTPTSPDYIPIFSETTPPVEYIYGEKFRDLDRLVCKSVAKHNILVEQLTFQSLDDSSATATSSSTVAQHITFQDTAAASSSGISGLVCRESINCNNINTNTLDNSEERSVYDLQESQTVVTNSYYKIKPNLIIIPSPTIRNYTSFIINRRDIPKLCGLCFRQYCVCEKNGIDQITNKYHNRKSYEFFKDGWRKQC